MVVEIKDSSGAAVVGAEPDFAGITFELGREWQASPRKNRMLQPEGAGAEPQIPVDAAHIQSQRTIPFAALPEPCFPPPGLKIVRIGRIGEIAFGNQFMLHMPR